MVVLLHVIFAGVKIQRPSDSSNEMEVFAAQRLAKLNLESGAAAPPRPPKPFHINTSGSNYLNLSATSTLPKTSKCVYFFRYAWPQFFYVLLLSMNVMVFLRIIIITL